VKKTAKDNLFWKSSSLKFKGRSLDLSTPLIMGIINVTPDSFYRHSKIQNVGEIIETAARMIDQGADIIDIGGYSSRPGAENIDVKTESSRVIPSVKAIVRELPNAIISVDTFRADIANAAVNEGAGMVNDISGGNLDSNMFKMIARLKVPYVLMHMKGVPKNMQIKPKYDSVFDEVLGFFEDKLKLLDALGIDDVIIDPGFGFGKSLEDNYTLLKRLDEFRILKRSILVGISRKSMITNLLDIPPEQALNGTISLNTIALFKGAKILRVHDVAQAKEVINLSIAVGI